MHSYACSIYFFLILGSAWSWFTWWKLGADFFRC